jgi:hypothetical protein
VNGNCLCRAGYELSENCAQPNCDICGPHGTCLTPNVCTCNRGWTGPNCDQIVCQGPQPCCSQEGICSNPSSKPRKNCAFFENQDADPFIAVQPDLIVGATLQPRLQVSTFGPCHCAVDEGCTLPGSRLLLRFSTETENIG